MITLKEAAERIGSGVVYSPFGQPERREDGTIERVNEHYVFVRYSRTMVAATSPADLTWLSAEATR